MKDNLYNNDEILNELNDNNNGEIWKPYVGERNDLIGYVIVSNKGRVFKIGTNTSKNRNGIIKGSITSQGYHRINVSINGKLTNAPVHRLIAETFIDNPDDKPYVDHLNAKRADNRVENLRWVTHSENMRNPNYTKVLRKRSKEIAKNNYMGKANQKKICLEHLDGHKLYYNSIKDMLKDFGTNANVSRRINTGKYFTHKYSKLKGYKIYEVDSKRLD